MLRRLITGDWIAYCRVVVVFFFLLVSSLLRCFMVYVLCFNFKNSAKQLKPHKMLSLADDMGQLTLGCTALEEEEGCISPG